MSYRITGDLETRRELAHRRRRWARAMQHQTPSADPRLARLTERWIAALDREAAALDPETTETAEVPAL
jgi:hypothetical protein